MQYSNAALGLMHQPEFLHWLHQQIPLTAAMQVDRLEYDGQRVRLHAPLAPNLNDKGTGFAGSTSGLATLTGWSLLTLWLQAKGIDADVMIARSEVEFIAPLTEDLQTEAQLPDADLLVQFENRLRQRGRARLELTVRLGDERSPVLKLTGDYAARLR